jgi:hypothetical protein
VSTLASEHACSMVRDRRSPPAPPPPGSAPLPAPPRAAPAGPPAPARRPAMALAPCRTSRDVGGGNVAAAGNTGTACRRDDRPAMGGADMTEMFFVPFDYDVLRAGRHGAPGRRPCAGPRPRSRSRRCEAPTWRSRTGSSIDATWRLDGISSCVTTAGSGGRSWTRRS